MKDMRERWLEKIGSPVNYEFAHSLRLAEKFEGDCFDGELYEQANGPGTFQRVMMLFPKEYQGKLPGVLVPFYYPEAMLGYDPFTGEDIPKYYQKIAMMYDLVCRGYAVASADCYHLTYLQTGRDRLDYYRWEDVGEAICREQPGWTGIGKLVADTRLLIDALANDPRVDEDRLGITGHSLGGKMAFYTGCLDERIKAIMVNDFGFIFESTNWESPWYWGSKLEILKKEGLDHTTLLGTAAPKPFYLIAGETDTDDSWDVIRTTPGYEDYQSHLGFSNHKTGHNPPQKELEAGYDFLDKWLKSSS